MGMQVQGAVEAGGGEVMCGLGDPPPPTWVHTYLQVFTSLTSPNSISLMGDGASLPG